MRFTYLVPIDHVRKTIVSTKVQTMFHTGMPTLDDQNPLVSELEPGLIPACVEHTPLEPLERGISGTMDMAFSLMATTSHGNIHTSPTTTLKFQRGEPGSNSSARMA